MKLGITRQLVPELAVGFASPSLQCLSESGKVRNQENLMKDDVAGCAFLAFRSRLCIAKKKMRRWFTRFDPMLESRAIGYNERADFQRFDA